MIHINTGIAIGATAAVILILVIVLIIFFCIQKIRHKRYYLYHWLVIFTLTSKFTEKQMMTLETLLTKFMSIQYIEQFIECFIRVIDLRKMENKYIRIVSNYDIPRLCKCVCKHTYCL